MAVALSDGPVVVHQGDVRECLRELAGESVQCVVTSPPYWGLRDYGTEGQLGLEPTPEEYVANMVAVFREVRRVLRKDGTLWLNLGDSYAGSGKGPSNNSELDRPYRCMSNIAAAPIPNGIKPKDLVGIPWRVAFALQAAGWWLRSDIIWSKPNPMPESVTDRPTKAHEYLFLLTRSPRYYYDADAIREDGHDWGPRDRSQSISRVTDFRGPGQPAHRGLMEGDPTASRNKHTVWTVATQPYPEAHFATYPEDLVIPCIKAGSREGDVVLDPFAGSGTTLAVARRLGRRAVGIELNPEYVALIEKRVGAVALPLLEMSREEGE